GGPSWIIFGFLKVLMGMLLMVLAFQLFIPVSELDNPTYLYWVVTSGAASIILWFSGC
ncbi:hypothetical protein IAF53_21065, partial [Acinetobacter baumannii]|nr:hypothetical protein [Acinetobacter baumannii]